MAASRVAQFFLGLSFLACGAKLDEQIQLAAVGAASATQAEVGGGLVVASARVDAMKYIAEGSDFLLVFDVKRMVASPLMDTIVMAQQMAELRQEKLLQDLSAAGIDPLRNVDKVIVSGRIEKEEFAVIVTGTFDEVAAVEGLKKIIEQNKKGFVEALDKGVLLFSEKEAPLASAKLMKGLSGSPKLLSGIESADMTWPLSMVFVMPDSAKDELKRSSPLPGFSSLEDVSINLRMTQQAELSIVFQFESAAGAEEARGSINAMLPMLPSLWPPLASPKMTTDGNFVRLLWSADESQLRALLTPTTEQPITPLPH